MSTTLAVLRVLMPSDHDAIGDSLLVTSSTPSSLMASSSAPSLVAKLDPVLVDFWSSFPCPPPWNEGLLFSANWTSCVSQAVGDNIRWFLADRCNIPHNTTHLLPGGGGGGGAGGGGDGFGGYGEEGAGETCDLSCKVLVGLFALLLVLALIGVAALVVHRRRSQRKDQRGAQLSGGSAGDRGRAQYAGIHYASASVINREGERPLPPCPPDKDGGGGVGAGLPRQLHSYVYNPRDTDHPAHPSPPLHHHHHHHHQPHPPNSHPQGFHLHLCPVNRRAAYRAMEPAGHPAEGERESVSTEGSSYNPYYPPHVYDYISDTDSLRWRGSVVRGEDGNEYTYCTCEHGGNHSDDHGAEYAGGGGGHHGGGGDDGRGEGRGEGRGGGGDNNTSGNSCSTPRQSEGYHSDRDDRDHVRQPHEVSKPNPRYPPEKGEGGGVVVLGGNTNANKTRPGLNNNNNNDNTNISSALAFRDGVVVDDARRDQGSSLHPAAGGGTGGISHRPPAPLPPVADRRAHVAAFPVSNNNNNSNNNNRGPASTLPPGVNSFNNQQQPPPVPVDVRHHNHHHHQPGHPRFPDTINTADPLRNRGDAFVNTGFNGSLPSNARTRSGPPGPPPSAPPPPPPPPRAASGGETDPRAPPAGGGERLTFVNAQTWDDADLSALDGESCGRHDYEDPRPPTDVDETAHRANALALHPGYFADYFDGGTSSV